MKYMTIQVLTAIALGVAPQVSDTATFTLKTNVSVSEDHVYLGDVADCSGSSQLCEEIYGVEITPSPLPGRTSVITADRLRQVLAKEWPHADVFFNGSKAVKIVAQSQVLTADLIKQELEQLLLLRMSQQDRFRVSVGKVQLPLGLSLRPGEYRLEFQDLEDGSYESPEWVKKYLSGPRRIVVQVVRDLETATQQRLLTGFAVSVNFMLSERLPVLKQPMKVGRVVSEDDVEEQWIEIHQNALKFAASKSQIVGRRLSRSLSAMEPIPENALTVPEIVKRGKIVVLSMKGSGVDVSSKVEALESGSYGQIIDARYAATKKKIRVRIVGADHVEFVF
ncbi:flagella basal body P-ring formation protein [Planctomyces bekefii]|uniref:Flagella basal body P-ring formation protein n=1 Tax=Planctomyces bekefii TaxID=1653850 RepID=A0A5C6M9S1_9PLAN|nr:flagella basal body P-ring formation protein [Planctomyces bekefii]